MTRYFIVPLTNFDAEACFRQYGDEGVVLPVRNVPKDTGETVATECLMEALGQKAEKGEEPDRIVCYFLQLDKINLPGSSMVLRGTVAGMRHYDDIYDLPGYAEGLWGIRNEEDVDRLEEWVGKNGTFLTFKACAAATPCYIANPGMPMDGLIRKRAYTINSLSYLRKIGYMWNPRRVGAITEEQAKALDIFFPEAWNTMEDLATEQEADSQAGMDAMEDEQSRDAFLLQVELVKRGLFPSDSHHHYRRVDR